MWTLKERIVIYFCLFKVTSFFKKRINEQYPPLTVVEDITVRNKKQHEAFMNAKTESVLGRKAVLVEVSSAVDI